jgi:hypothetical protein
MPNWYRNANHNGIGVGSVKHGGFSAGSATLDVTTLPANEYNQDQFSHQSEGSFGY